MLVGLHGGVSYATGEQASDTRDVQIASVDAAPPSLRHLPRHVCNHLLRPVCPNAPLYVARRIGPTGPIATHSSIVAVSIWIALSSRLRISQSLGPMGLLAMSPNRPAWYGALDGGRLKSSNDERGLIPSVQIFDIYSISDIKTVRSVDG
jgi:hypothetical protein